ncbi:helix-turn-helix domain-containing protein [Amphiplicatus metriothermophilus]|uniref:DNA binding domain-containing protein, excisionase family n=1 Tax=Amphiplicatus metriothermophilus TaxID=1519374 RepID=A0A239PXU8_9PROT|nr:helix-turn-helix domain-containing protein [Amphiplicatus metriothermophilus]MBB5519883.1 excisionase family DNA binding protein [Amphiplicatus metriothermophilus]SNT74786.1 DNA binding domain-containing protein, excisionase family [Amphiplicatus metriothermophilus]
MTEPLENRLLRLGEVVEMLQVSRPTLYRLAREERLELRKIGRCSRITGASVARFLRQGEEGAR